MADAYGLDDYSLLSAPQQDTARMVQRSFDASLAGRNRNLERFNLATSGPLLTEYANDSALKRAQTTAGILNQNQQLQSIIDASHRTPHGAMENLSAYLPLAGGLARLYPALFGTNNSFSQQGIIPSAYNAVKSGYNNLVAHWTTDPTTGNRIGLDAQGNIVTPAQGPGGMDYGAGYGDVAAYSNPAFANDYNWSSAQSPFAPDYNWTSGFDLGDWGF